MRNKRYYFDTRENMPLLRILTFCLIVSSAFTTASDAFALGDCPGQQLACFENNKVDADNLLRIIKMKEEQQRIENLAKQRQLQLEQEQQNQAAQQKLQQLQQQLQQQQNLANQTRQLQEQQNKPFTVNSNGKRQWTDAGAKAASELYRQKFVVTGRPQTQQEREALLRQQTIAYKAQLERQRQEQQVAQQRQQQQAEQQRQQQQAAQQRQNDTIAKNITDRAKETIPKNTQLVKDIYNKAKTTIENNKNVASRIVEKREETLKKNAYIAKSQIDLRKDKLKENADFVARKGRVAGFEGNGNRVELGEVEVSKSEYGGEVSLGALSFEKDNGANLDIGKVNAVASLDISDKSRKKIAIGAGASVVEGTSPELMLKIPEIFGYQFEVGTQVGVDAGLGVGASAGYEATRGKDAGGLKASIGGDLGPGADVSFIFNYKKAPNQAGLDMVGKAAFDSFQ